jgi:hypothetical protein
VSPVLLRIVNASQIESSAGGVLDTIREYRNSMAASWRAALK